MLTPSRMSVPPTGSQETPVLANLQRTEEKLEIYIYIYIYIYTHTHTHRERETEKEREENSQFLILSI